MSKSPLYRATLQKVPSHSCMALFAIASNTDLIHLAAHAHSTPEGVRAMGRIFPMRPSRETVLGRSVLQAAVVHLPDVQQDSEYTELLAATFHGSALGVPLLRHGQPIGAIAVGRSEPRAFDENQIALLQTFADQAVIAIENVRLFTELGSKHAALSEPLNQQTATAEILRVISSSPTNLQPVLNAVAENAARVCEGQDATVVLVEGTLLRRVAQGGDMPVPARDTFPLTRGTVMGRSVIDRQTIQVDDPRALADEYPEGAGLSAAFGHRTTLATPLLREGGAIGTLLIRRMDVRPFTAAQIALLQTFADQAVIAIENVRLFTQLQASNRELTRH